MPAPQGHLLSSGAPGVQYDPYRWLALNVFRVAVIPPPARARRGVVVKWAIDRMLWLESEHGRLWVQAAGQDWDKMRARFLALYREMGLADDVARAAPPEDRPTPAAGYKPAGVERDRRIRALFYRGNTVRSLALTFHLTRRTIYLILKEGQRADKATTASADRG